MRKACPGTHSSPRTQPAVRFNESWEKATSTCTAGCEGICDLMGVDHTMMTTQLGTVPERSRSGAGLIHPPRSTQVTRTDGIGLGERGRVGDADARVGAVLLFPALGPVFASAGAVLGGTPVRRVPRTVSANHA